MHTKAPHQRCRANYRQTIDHEYSDALALFEQLCTELHSGASPALPEYLSRRAVFGYPPEH